MQSWAMSPKKLPKFFYKKSVFVGITVFSAPPISLDSNGLVIDIRREYHIDTWILALFSPVRECVCLCVCVSCATIRTHYSFENVYCIAGLVTPSGASPLNEHKFMLLNRSKIYVRVLEPTETNISNQAK